jgi:DNA-binding LytR/AlgR family response regulator
MGGMDGFNAAVKLKGMQNPPLIVFVTNSGEYTFRGYEVAFRYLPKPVTYEVLAGVMSSAIARIAPFKLTITADGSSYVIPINEIRYFETSGHDLAAHTTGSKFQYRMKLSEVESLLPINTFAAPHKGYLVNLDFVDIMDGNGLLLTCGKRIPVSRRCKKDFEQALFRFVRRMR